MSAFLPGTQVTARGLLWEIVHVEPAGEQTRFRLRCAQGDLRGREFDFLHPFEEIRPVSRDLEPAKAGRLRPWLLYHQAFLLEQELGPTALQAVQPGRLEIAPYQLVPVMRALRMSRPRLLLADGVGLGKTVEAGLVMAELIARRRAHRVLIVSPAGPLLQQWRREMRERFGLRFDVVKDWGALQELRRGLVLGANPFDHLALCLTSIDFAKQEKVLQDLERATWDLAIIDEAHHCVRLGSAGDGEDSRRRRLAEVLARQSDGLLLLTATPHDGYDAHFASLMELLDPSLVDGRGALRPPMAKSTRYVLPSSILGEVGAVREPVDRARRQRCCQLQDRQPRRKAMAFQLLDVVVLLHSGGRTPTRGLGNSPPALPPGRHRCRVCHCRG